MHLSISRNLLLFLTAVFAVLIFQIAFTTGIFAATETWDGGGADNYWTTDANWLDDTAPLADDDLVFDTDLYDFSTGNPNNDYAGGTQFNSILVQGATTGAAGAVSLAGNAFDLVAGITVSGGTSLTISPNLTLTEPQAFTPTSGTLTITGTIALGANTLTIADGSDVTLSGAISGTGGVTSNNSGTVTLSAANTFDGAVAVNAGTINVSNASGLGSVTGDTTVADGASLLLSFMGGSDVTLSEDITFEGLGASVAAFRLGPAGSGSTTLPDNGDLTVDGTVTLSADGTFYADSYNFTNTTVTFSDFVDGGNTLSQVAGSGSPLVLNTTTQQAASPVTSTVSDTLPATNVAVNPNTILVVNGTRGDIDVLPGGTLMGSGTVGNIAVYSGTLANGTSPGCLTSGDIAFNGSSTFIVEIDGTTACTGYDQSVVTGTVSLGDAVLSVVVGAFTPANGDEFIIINNDSNDAVSGTFNGLSEGSSFVSGVTTFTISYTGGDGNDVVLTVDSAAPAAPNTGLGLSSTYMATAILTMVLSGSLYSYAFIRNSRRR